jgi:xylan 1,4-beta-xylosidase
MNERHEIIDFGSSIPICCFIYRLGYAARHWHNSIELLYVIKGQVEVIINETYNLLEEDILLVNSMELHELAASDCTLFAIQIKPSLFDMRIINESKMRFDCNSSLSTGKQRFFNIKHIIAQFIKANAVKESYNQVIAMALSYSLLFELLRNFKAEDSEVNIDQNRKNQERLGRILNYIGERFRGDLSLAEIAEHEHLSIPYLSQFFAKNMNMNFLSYLNKLRMDAAIKELLTSEESVETVSHNSGFPNPRAFVNLFKKEYNMLPSQYRSENRRKISLPEKKNNGSSANNYLVIEHHDYLSKLADYLSHDSEFDVYPNYFSAGTNITSKAIDVSKSLSKLKHSFKTFTSVGKAKEILFSDVQDMLRILQKEIGFEHIKFHGILSDDMKVYNQTKDGKIIISFVYVDKVLDFLLSIGLKPLVQLSFMPEALAKYPDKAVFNSGFIASEPKDMDTWNNLIREFTIHLLDRYGKDQVEQWKFTVWNEPDTPTFMFGMSNQEIFYDFYKNTYNTVKSCDPNICFGSPSSFFTVSNKTHWIDRFTKWCSLNNCIPDFVNVNFYSTQYTGDCDEINDTWGPVGGIKLNEDPDVFNKFVGTLRKFVDSAYGKQCEIFLTEWNSTPSHYDLISDTCFKSCYIVKNILENYDCLDSFGYWVLTDFFEEEPILKEVFHGGLGLFTYNGIKKPGYYAFYLLNKLGTELIEKGDGYFITKEKSEFRIILYNYKHYSSLYADGETFDMTFINRYTPFGSEDKREFSLLLNGVEESKYELTEYIVNRQYGSCFDKWVEMGARPLVSKEEIETLMSLSKPMINKYILSSFDKRLSINVILDLLEIRYICIKPA